MPQASVREIDEAIASLATLGAKLGPNLKPLLRTIQGSRSEDAGILDITRATEIEAVLRLTEREGGQEPWEGRLDLSKPAHCAVMNRIMFAQRIDDQGNVHVVNFDAERIKARLGREAGEVVCSVGGEFEHVSRALSGLPRILFDLLVEYQGDVVEQQLIADRVIGDEEASPNRIYRVKNRLMEILEADFAEVAKRIESVPGGYRLT